ncbi:TniQ family protein [Paenibacillus sp. KS-LC4]|uniref:TniQ family protein n=1 Tax=Paenibacillus sp. KS-LC4 TaxID=2979727 RepID=UPI0030CBDFAB
MLLNRPTSFYDESLRGYMIRLSESNYNSQETIKLYKATGLYGYNIPKNLMVLDSDTDLSKLAELVGKDLRQLELLTFQPHVKNVPSVKVETLLYQLDHFGTSMYRSQICPACLRDHGYMRKIWDLTVVTTCHIHNCKLHDQCPNCKKNLSPFRKRINLCDCGFDLRELPIVASTDVQVSNLLHRKLFDIKSFSCERSTFFDKHSFLTCLYIILYFTGVISGRFFNEKRQRFSKSLNDSKLTKLCQAAYVLFQDWPNNFFCFLDAYRVNQINQKQSGVLEGFGKFHMLIFQKLDFPAFKNILDKYVLYISNYWNGGYCNQHVLTAGNEQLLTLLQTNADVFKTLLKSVNGINQSVKRRNAYQRNEMKIKPDGAMLSSPKVMKSLGISYGQVFAFRERGLIQAVRGPEIDGYNRWLYFSKDLEQFHNNLNENIIYVSEEEYLLLININQAKKCFTTWGLTFCDLVEGILNDEIRPYTCKKVSGLKEFRFVKDDVMNFLKKGSLTINDISRELKVCKKYVSSWSQKGYLISNSLSSGAVVIIKKTDYLFFKKTYMTGTDALKKQTKVKSVESLVKFLRKRDVEPASGPKVDGGQGYLFKRDMRLYYWLSQMREK